MFPFHSVPSRPNGSIKAPYLDIIGRGGAWQWMPIPTVACTKKSPEKFMKAERSIAVAERLRARRIVRAEESENVTLFEYYSDAFVQLRDLGDVILSAESHTHSDLIVMHI